MIKSARKQLTLRLRKYDRVSEFLLANSKGYLRGTEA